MARDHQPGDDASVFLGEDLLAWLVLAIGAALAVGNALVICLPGKPKGAVECLGFVVGAIPVFLVDGAAFHRPTHEIDASAGKKQAFL